MLAARDFGFIDTFGLVERLERTIDTINQLDKWKGHLYNWYDTITLKPLPPLYVSTVDSGNFAVCLVTIKEGLTEWLDSDFKGDGYSGLVQRRSNASEVLDGLCRGIIAYNGRSSRRKRKCIFPKHQGRMVCSRANILSGIETLINRTDFRPLYDHKAKLFHLGYNAGVDKPDPILYDLMASEARQSSLIAIALGHVPASHWHALGRTMTRVGRRSTSLSWSGTMFEYLMPWLFTRTYRNTIWDSTYRAVVHRQIEYAHQRGVPFGFSESGYYAFDYQMNYQYRAFGVPGLGFKRGLEQDLVVAPYATILALPYAQRQGLTDLNRLEVLGARGKYGYFEAVDFTTERLPKNRTNIVIRSFMAHHQGMSLLALANLLAPKKIIERFTTKRVRSRNRQSTHCCKIINIAFKVHMVFSIPPKRILPCVNTEARTLLHPRCVFYQMGHL